MFVSISYTSDLGLRLWKLLALMNIIENLLNFAYIYLAHVSKWQAAPLIGFTGAVMTLSKTVLYMVQDYYCNFCATGHNPLQTWITMWVIPSGYVMVTIIALLVIMFLWPRFWILFPGLIVMRLGGDLVEALVKSGYSPEKKKKWPGRYLVLSEEQGI